MSGEVEYQEKRPHDDHPRLRIRPANQIFSVSSLWGAFETFRLVNHSGATSTSYRFERVSPG